MKKRHNVENNLKKFYKMVKNGQVVFDSPIQRDDNQWTNTQKSQLIRSIIVDYAIPPIYSVGIEDKENNQMIYSVLDGKQRLTSLIEFIDNSYQLNSKIQDVEYEGHVYNIKNKRFEKLPPELQDAIYDYSLTMIYYVFLTDNELVEMFTILNNGTPLTRQQKANASMGMESARKMNELKKHPFMQINASLAKNHNLKATDVEVITQAMMIIDDYHALDSYGAKNMDRYSESLRDKAYIFDIMKDVLDYAHVALDFYTDRLTLKKTVLPMTLYIAKLSMDENLDKDLFLRWIQDFKLAIEGKSQIKITFAEYMGVGSFSKNKVYGRVNSAIKHYRAFLDLQKNPIEIEQEELPIVF